MYATATTARNKFVADGVGSTSQERILVMLYDRLLRDLDDAAASIGAGDTFPAHEALTHAQDIVAELHSALDPSRWDGAEALGGLYAYLADVLARANIAKSPGLVAEARSVVAPLRDTWDEACTAMSAPQVSGSMAPAGGLDVAG